jgi:hypothetical protein
MSNQERFFFIWPDFVGISLLLCMCFYFKFVGASSGNRTRDLVIMRHEPLYQAGAHKNEIHTSYFLKTMYIVGRR